MRALDDIDAQLLDDDIAKAAKLIGPHADRAQIKAAIDLLLRIAPELENLKELPSPAEVRVALEDYANLLQKVRYAAQGLPQPLRGLLPASFRAEVIKQEEWVLWLAGALVVQDGSMPRDLRKLAAVEVARGLLISHGRQTIRQLLPGSDGYIVTLKKGGGSRGWRKLSQLLYGTITGEYDADLSRYQCHCDEPGYGGHYFISCKNS
jgi:hypothetical protein